MRSVFLLPMAALCLHAQAPDRTSLSLLADRVRPGLVAFDVADSAEQVRHYEDAVSPHRGLAFRLSHDLIQAGPGLLSFDATYRPRTESQFRHTLNGGPDPHYGLARDTFGYGYLAVGGEWSLRRALSGGLGLEVRMEGLDRRKEFKDHGAGMPAFVVEDRGHLVRPWLRAHVARGFEGSRLKPFLRAEAAWALESRRPAVVDPMSLNQDVRPLAPQFQVALAAGLRL